MVTKAQVLLVNSKGWQGLSRLPRTLNRASCEITVLGPRGGAIGLSRYPAHRITTSNDLPEIINALRKHLEEEPNRYQWVIFGDEPALYEAARHYKEPWLTRWFPVEPGSRAQEIILSKGAFAEACMAAGIPTPITRVCSTLADAEAAAREVGFPLMLKLPEGAAGGGVRKLDSADELPAAFRLWEYAKPLLIQQFLGGRVGACEILFDHGKAVCWLASYINKCWPGSYGPSSVRELMTHPAMESIIGGIGKITGYHGLCGIDFIHGPGESLVALEFNPRPTPCYHLGKFAGVNFARSIEAMLAGSQLIQQPTVSAVKPPKVYLFSQHIVRCIEAGEIRDLVHWLPGVGYHDVPWDEPLMLTRQLLKIGYVGLRTGGRFLKSCLHRSAAPGTSSAQTEA